MHDIIRRILSARVYDVAVQTPLDEAPRLSTRLGHRVRLKREDLQPIFSFKLRGAFNKVASLSTAERATGVIAASAGNHAQGVALAASRLDARALIVMPRTTPSIKTDAVRALGAEVVLHGDAFDAARRHAAELAGAHGMVLVHPYDDWDVIAGQGTIGAEILHQAGAQLDAIFVPVGGGGLIAGVAAYVKYVRPGVRVVGVEPEDAASMAAALAAGAPVDLPSVGIFVDGVAVARVGDRPFELAREHVDEIVTVTTDQICAAIKDIFDDTRSIAEPAGALALAGLKRWAEVHGGGPRLNLVAIDTGANTNFDRLRHVSERAEVGEAREAILAVTIPERPGSFRDFCDAIGDRAITEFNYRMGDSARARVFAGIALGARRERAEVVERLTARGYPTHDLTDNEVAKLHLRHMVGGPSALAEDERVCRVQFPERPGALRGFLDRLGARWNISMFHYRNHGAAFGRVLVGMQVPERERAEWRETLDAIGYAWTDESDNPAYRLFLDAMPG